MRGSRRTNTNSWNGTLLQDLETGVLTDIASGKQKTDGKVLRQEAARMLKKRKDRIGQTYEDGADRMQCV